MSLPPGYDPHYRYPIPYQAHPPVDPDNGHLSALVICHYIWGAVSALFSCMFLVHIGMGVAVLNGKFPMPPPPPATNAATFQQAMPPAFGWFFIAMGSFLLLMGWTLAICNLISARSIARRRRRLFSLIVAGFNCMAFPIGTVLGVFTFVVLLRESVQRKYDGPSPS